MPYVSFCELTLAVEQNYYLRLECFVAQTDMFRHIDSIMKPRNLPENPKIFPHSVLIQPNPAIASLRRDKIPYICDFSRGGLNARLHACIQTLLRGHKYRVSVSSGVSALLKLNRKSITLL